jgi:hypothetical protein
MTSGLSPIIVFDGTNPVAESILWTPISTIQSPAFAFAFTPTNNDWIVGDYQSTGPQAGYTYSPPASTAPNLFGFIGAITEDTSINAEAQMGLGAWYPQLQMFLAQASLIQAAWTNLVAAYSGTWLTSPVQTAVEGYAVTYNIPLVSS